MTAHFPRQALRLAAVPLAASCLALSIPAQADTVASPATPQATASRTEDASQALPRVELTGRSASGAYLATEASGAKTELPLRELPQSVRVMTRQALDDLGATRLDDALDYVGGVSRQNSFGGLWDNIAIRGLAGNENTGMATLLNGFSSNRGFNAPRDLAGVERVEFLKGPAAALYGASEPGGTLNIVSKKPLWTRAHALELYLGSDQLRRLALDSTGALSETLAYRLNVAKEDRDSFRDQVSSHREVLAPALSWKLGADTVLDYRGEWLKHRTPLDRGVVADAQGRLGVVPRERFLGEPADGDVTVRNSSHQLMLSHDWSDHWRGRVGLSWRHTALNGYSTEPTALQADGRTLTRQRRFRDYDSQDVALQAEVQGRVQALGLTHELLVGAETYRFRMDSLMLRVNPSASAPYAIDVLNPVYGQAQPTPLANTDTRERQRNVAVYLQDVVHLAPQWRLLAGLRSDHYDQTLLNRRNATQTTQSPSTLVPRLGLSWLPSSQWTVYGSASESFRPNVSSGGRSFDPEQGRALELGSKWQSADGRLGATAALFHIVKRHVLTSDPADASLQVAAGEVRSQGLELDLAGQLSAHWRLNAALVLADAEVTRDNNAALVGSRLLNVARINGSVLAVYEDRLANGQRWSLGGGLTHVGKRLGQTGTSFELPAYTIAKLVAYWELSSRLRLSLDVDNLFDRDYYSSSYSRVWVTPGAARSVSLGLQARF